MNKEAMDLKARACYGTVWGEEREGGNNVLILQSEKIKNNIKRKKTSWPMSEG